MKFPPIKSFRFGIIFQIVVLMVSLCVIINSTSPLFLVDIHSVIVIVIIIIIIIIIVIVIIVIFIIIIIIIIIIVIIIIVIIIVIIIIIIMSGQHTDSVSRAS